MLIVALVVAAASGIVGCLAGGCLGATLAWRLARGKAPLPALPPLPPLPSLAQIPAAVASVLRGKKGTQPPPPPEEPAVPARRPPALQA